MITERGNRKRLGIAAGYMFFGQSTGVLVLNNYGISWPIELKICNADQDVL